MHNREDSLYFVNTRKQAIGAWGEQEAANYLSGLGYEIPGRNIRTQHGEIDLIAQLGEITCFVEVRTLSSSRFAHPEETITRRKQTHMLEAVKDYTQSHEIDCWQIDAVAVEGKPGDRPAITHFENVIGRNE
jgi:putative endonuclease